MNDGLGCAGKDPIIRTHAATVSYGSQPVLWNVDAEIPRGALTGIIGPNGAGKSTLIKAILGIVPMAGGRCVACDRDGKRLPADAIGYVPQRNTVDWDFPTDVFDVVMMGTYGKLRWFERPGKSQRQQTWQALEFAGLQDLARRQIGQLSGGQQQRVFLARAFVQQPQVYLLDEPFAGVDATAERALVDLLRQLVQSGCSIVMVHHDLAKARQYFQYVLLLNRRLIAQGQTDEVLTDEMLSVCYGEDR